MADIENEKQGYSGFEKFMFFVTPILFTIVLLGVLVTLFDFDLRNKALEAGNAIPLLRDVLPEPSVAGEESDKNQEQTINTNNTAKIAELTASIAAKDASLKQAEEAKTKQSQEIKDLQAEVDQLKASNSAKQLDDEQYQNKIVELASMYAKITPSKAAPILESMTIEEAVLVLDAMRPDDRVKILEKMTPKVAADATVMLKDGKTAKDRQIAALQARIKQQDTAATQTVTVLDKDQLKATFNTMDANSAADLLLKMADVSPSKVLRILNTVDDAARSRIVAAMSGLNKDITAQLVSKLMTGK
ncbi:MotE family protein [Paenibacillus sepulcri]|uniref:MgtE protein n=1 Tax=Paenibacillus sepulcri TaxID=359917 RepID=A0ABS7BYJ3_9BACL|nr:MgtE protein [Paenibacillus sepulcri]